MVDFTDVLSRAVAGKNTYEERRAVYERARQALVSQLRALDPPLAESDVTRQRLALEEAIRKIESDASTQAAAARAAAARRPLEALRNKPASATSEAPVRPPSSVPPMPQAPVASPATPVANDIPLMPSRPEMAPRPEERQVQAAAPEPPYEASSPAGEDAMPLSGNELRAEPRMTSLSRALDEENEIARSLARRAERSRPMVVNAGAEEKGDPLVAPRQPQIRSGTIREPLWRRWLMFILILSALGVAAAGGVYLALRWQKSGGSEAPIEKPAVPSAPVKSTDRVEPSAGARPATANAPVVRPGTPATSQASAVLYDENSQSSNGVDAYKGSVAWRVDTDNGAQGQERVIRGLVDIPERGIKILLTIRRNLDQALPASHTLELLFDVPPSFAFGGVESLEQVFMKTAEQVNGLPLRGALARITSGYFLIGLSALGPNRENNIALLRDRPWFDITFLYRNGRRAVLAVGKGEQGEKTFQDIFAQWGG